MFAAKERRIILLHGRCFRTCYVLKLLSTMNANVLKLLSTMNAGTRTHEKRARTRPNVKAKEI